MRANPRDCRIEDLERVAAAPGRFALAVPVRAPYAQLTKAVEGAVVGKRFAADTPAGAVDVKVKAVHLYPSNENLVIGIDFDASPVTGNVKLSNSATYLIDGPTKVGEGRNTNPGVLTVEPGTLITGSGASLSYLAVQPGSKLIAQGLQDAPIIFTGPTDVPGSWAGLVLAGNAVNNSCTGATPCAFEADSNVTFGGNDDNDSSGALRYVQIRYAGQVIRDRVQRQHGQPESTQRRVAQHILAAGDVAPACALRRACRIALPAETRRSADAGQARVPVQVLGRPRQRVARRIAGAAAEHPAAHGEAAGDRPAVAQPAHQHADVVAPDIDIGGAVVQVEHKLHTREALREVGRHRGQPAHAQACGRHHPQFTAGALRMPRQRFGRIPQAVHRAARRLVELPPRLGRLDHPRRAVEQPHLHAVLQLGQALADHRLGQAHAPGGAADAAHLDDPQEGFDVLSAQVHGALRCDA